VSAAPLKSLLFVDDDEDIREIVALALGLDGALDVVTSPGGEQALAMMRARRPDLVMMDVMMPGMDGPAVLGRMRADASLQHIPVIFMTAKTDTADTARLRRLSAIGVIAKPFDPMTLGTQVRALWAAR
jgi:DNA-binding response OmpR family regulator